MDNIKIRGADTGASTGASTGADTGASTGAFRTNKTTTIRILAIIVLLIITLSNIMKANAKEIQNESIAEGELIEIVEDAVPLYSWMQPPSEQPEEVFGFVDLACILISITLCLTVHISLMQAKFPKDTPGIYCFLRSLSLAPAIMSLATFIARESLAGTPMVTCQYTFTMICYTAINIGIYMIIASYIAKEAVVEVTINTKKILGGLIDENRA